MPKLPSNKVRASEYREILKRWVDFYKEQLAMVLRSDIERFGITQTDVAKALGTSRQYIQKEYGYLWKKKHVRKSN